MDAIFTECGPNSCTTTVRAGSFFASTKAEANALARDALNKAGVMRKACCDTPDMIGCVGERMTAAFSVILGKPPFQWSLIWGSIPAGLHISFQDDGRTMIIDGIPTTAGNLMGVFTMLDGNGTVLTKTIQFFVMGITDDTLPAAVVGTAYSHQLTAVGGSGSYYFQLTSGALPHGLSLSAAGLISGIPTMVENPSFQISLSDQAVTNPVRGYLTVTIPYAATMQSIATLQNHSYKMDDFAILFAAVPDWVNNIIPGYAIWDGQLAASDVSPSFYGGVYTQKVFPNGAYCPIITINAYAIDGTLATWGKAIAYMLLTVSTFHLWPGGGSTIMDLWQGYRATTLADCQGTYTRIGGTNNQYGFPMMDIGSVTMQTTS